MISCSPQQETTVLNIIINNEDISNDFLRIDFIKPIAKISEVIRLDKGISGMDTLKEEVMCDIIKDIVKYINDQCDKSYKPFISGMGFVFDTREQLLKCAVNDYCRYMVYVEKYRLKIPLMPENLQSSVQKIDVIIERDEREKRLRIKNQIEIQIK